MSNSIRVTAEIAVDEGDRIEIIEAVNGALASVAGFIADTIIIEGVEGSVKLTKVGAHAHFHDREETYCSECIRLSEYELPGLD